MTARIWRDASLWPTKTPSDGVTRGSRTPVRRAQVAAIALILLALFAAVLIFG